jgi:hypothetical protein
MSFYNIKLFDTNKIILSGSYSMADLLELKEKYINLIIIVWHKCHGILSTGFYDDILEFRILRESWNIMYIYTTDDNIEQLDMNSYNIIINGLVDDNHKNIIKRKNLNLIVAGDEELMNNIDNLDSANIKLINFMRTRNVNGKYSIYDKSIYLGPSFGTLQELEKKNYNEKKTFDITFIGNINGSRLDRVKMRDIYLKKYPNNFFFMQTPYFYDGMTRDEYLNIFLKSKIIISPCGACNVDCFRNYEALECMCIPVSRNIINDVNIKNKNKHNYWKENMYDLNLCFTVNDWNDTGPIDRLLNDELYYYKTFNSLYSNWCKYKILTHNKMFTNLNFSNRSDSIDTIYSKLSIVITSSIIPDHPDTSTIEKVLDSLQNYDELSRCNIFILCDGLSEKFKENQELKYEKYKYNLILLTKKYKNRIIPIFYDEHLHQAGCVKDGLKYIRTPLVLLMEHDCMLIRQIDVKSIVSTMLKREKECNIKQVNLYISGSVYVNEKISPSFGINGELLIDKDPFYIDNVPLIRTKLYSVRPHFVFTDHLRYIVSNLSREYIEDKTYGSVIKDFNKNHDEALRRWGIFIYHPLYPGDFGYPGEGLYKNSDIRRHEHLDGRKHFDKEY